MSQSQAGGNDPKVPCPCGVEHPPGEKDRAMNAVNEATKVVNAFLEHHGVYVKELQMPVLIEALALGTATPLQQQAGVSLLVSTTMALSKLPAKVRDLLNDSNVELAGATVVNLGADGKAGTMPDFKVPGLAELLPKKSGKREDN